MSEYEISPEISGRVNANNYDIADMIAVINGDPVRSQVELDAVIRKNDGKVVDESR